METIPEAEYSFLPVEEAEVSSEVVGGQLKNRGNE